jgi:hypothetical protein
MFGFLAGCGLGWCAEHGLFVGQLKNRFRKHAGKVQQAPSG